MNYFEVTSIPNQPLQKDRLLEALGMNPFVLIFDLKDKKSILGTAESEKEAVETAIPGMLLQRTEQPVPDGPTRLLSVYRKTAISEVEWFRELFDVTSEGKVMIVAVPIRGKELENSKRKLEKQLGKRATKHNITSMYTLSGKPSGSMQVENYHESEDTIMLTDILESINATMLKSGIAYKVGLAICGNIKKMEEQIASRSFILSSEEMKCRDADELFEKVRRTNAFPLGAAHLRPMLCFRASERLSYVIPSLYYTKNTGVSIGNYMKDAVHCTDAEVGIDPATLNLGLIITGLSGSGKTSCSMALLESLIKFDRRTSMAIVSPTNEWNPFAKANGMRIITLYDGFTNINFFRCPEGAGRQRFYEDLAMILSSASDAGPFEGPMEKCLINAFSIAYKDTDAPEPLKVYNEIEESIIRFHGKRNNVGVRYTKHGENIKSSLENLRSILARPEYSAKEGVKFEDLLDNGVVFDLSQLSNSTKPYMYALILNQLYVLANGFGLGNDDKLNLVLCLEEAQLIFKDKDSAAVRDIRQRIQDFRKQGVCLMLLTHNVTDIDPTIRRLCQTKLYLKQASDVAAIAAKDLIFTYADDDSVIMKLKHLDSRIGALTYVSKKETEKLANDTIFIKTKDYEKHMW